MAAGTAGFARHCDDLTRLVRTRCARTLRTGAFARARRDRGSWGFPARQELECSKRIDQLADTADTERQV